jgi:hypothetical protein
MIKVEILRNKKDRKYSGLLSLNLRLLTDLAGDQIR